MFDEVGNALALLQELKIKQRTSVRNTRQMMENMGYASDPVLRPAV